MFMDLRAAAVYLYWITRKQFNIMSKLCVLRNEIIVSKLCFV